MKLKIKETAWGINRVAGGYRERVTADLCFPCEVGEIPDFGEVKPRFTIDEVSETGISLSVHYPDPKYNETWIINKGEEITYRPSSCDGGHFYEFKLI